MEIVGQTDSGVPAVSGIYKLMETNGLPLDAILQMIQGRAVVSWPHFILDAIAAGMNENRLRVMIEQAVTDIYGAEYWKEFSIRLEKIFPA